MACLCLGWSRHTGDEVWTSLERSLEGPFPTPLRYGGMVSREQHIWYCSTPEDPRPRVVGVIETTPGLEGILRCGLIIPQDSRQEARNGLDHRQSWKLASAEHEISHRYFNPLALVPNPFVEAFVPSSQQHDPLLTTELLGQSLVEGASRGGEHDLPKGSFASFQPLDSVEDWFGFQDHSGAAAERSIIDRTVSVPSEIAEVDRLYLNESFGLRRSKDARSAVSLDEFWEQGQEGEEHSVPPRNWGRKDRRNRLASQDFVARTGA